MTKRAISIGFIQPEEMEGNTIYVQLGRVEDHRHHPSAEAVSAQEFNYEAYVIAGDLFKYKGTAANSTYGGGRTRSPEEFINMLIRENDAEVTEERFKEDGLALTLQMKKMRASMKSLFARVTKLGEEVKAI